MAGAAMIQLEVASGIARLTMASGPVNAMSPGLLDGLNKALDDLDARGDWQVLVIASSVSAFSAGGDLQAMQVWMSGPDPGTTIGAYAAAVQRLCARVEQLPQVTIAECASTALGGGLELALSCDLRIASSKARFGLPEVRLGLLPAAGGTQRLTRLCGKATAMRLISGADIIDAATARELGIVQWIFDADDFAARSAAVSERIASMPRDALRYAKECIILAHRNAGDDGYRREITGLSALAESQETRTRVIEFLAGARDVPAPKD
jgi:enoyl-CoA hydratase